MARDLEELADVVVLCVKNAMAPAMERMVALETRVAPLADMRDRVAVVETKCCGEVAIPASVESRLLQAFEKLSALEYAMQRAADHESMITDLKARLAIAEATALQYAELASQARQMAEKLSLLEAKSAAPSDVELQIRKSIDPVTASIAETRERLVAVEVRAAVPGPPGANGTNGTNGADGAPGKDGLGFDDMSVEFDGDRTLLLKFERGAVKKSFPVVLPFQRYQGVFTEGKSYSTGDGVTWGGSEWHCNEPTSTKPGDGSKAWTLKVKRGRDGKDGLDAPGALPVVKVRG